MKLRNFSSLLSLCCLLLWAGTSCINTGTAAKKEIAETLEMRRFAAFAQKNNLAFPAAKQYYIIVQPKMCVSCVGYYLRELSSHIPKADKLILIGKSDAQKEVLQYIDHPNTAYFGNFNNNELDREPFLKSGIAYAVSQDGKVLKVSVINKTNIKSFLE